MIPTTSLRLGSRLPMSPVRGLLCLAMLLMLTACGPFDTSTPTPLVIPTIPATPERTVVLPSPTPTKSPALEALTAPGPTGRNPDRFLFELNGELWQLTQDGPAQAILRDADFGPWTASQDGESVTLVVYRDNAEEIVFLQDDGSLSQPFYRRPMDGTGQPQITQLAWSWDRTHIGVVFRDGAVGVLTFDPNDPFRASPPLEMIPMPTDAIETHALQWAPNSVGVSYLTTIDSRVSLLTTPLGEHYVEVLPASNAAAADVAAYTWLPGRGRIAYVLAGVSTESTLSGSIFSVAPDGTLTELLISAGRFAPAATITTLKASNSGGDIAFIVQVPNSAGVPRFRSAWITSIDGSDATRIPIDTTWQVVDMAWTSYGIVWRGIDVGYRGNPANTSFVLGVFNPDDGSNRIVFQSALVR